MLSLELIRAMDADRQRQVERAMLRRRLLDTLAIRPTGPADRGSMSAGRDTRQGTSGSPALGPAR